MKNNLIILVSALVVSSLFLVFVPTVSSECDGFGCVGTGLVRAFVYFIVIPLLLGIVGAFLNKEHRLKYALYAFGISLAVAIVMFYPMWEIAKRN